MPKFFQDRSSSQNIEKKIILCGTPVEVRGFDGREWEETSLIAGKATGHSPASPGGGRTEH